ncbi:MAG: hypothetical protein VX231_09510 [Pseudomonadota bacterium]|nr:hypothetical protein [Pseudomonadota bacterium]
MKFVLSTSFSAVEDLMTLAAPVANDSCWGLLTFSCHVVHPKKVSTPYTYK